MLVVLHEKVFKPGDIVETPLGRIAKVVRKGWQRYLLKYQEGDEVTLIGKLLKKSDKSFTDMRILKKDIPLLRDNQGRIVGTLRRKR